MWKEGRKSWNVLSLGIFCWDSQEFQPPSTIFPLDFFFEMGRGLGGKGGFS